MKAQRKSNFKHTLLQLTDKPMNTNAEWAFNRSMVGNQLLHTVLQGTEQHKQQIVANCYNESAHAGSMRQ